MEIPIYHKTFIDRECNALVLRWLIGSAQIGKDEEAKQAHGRQTSRKMYSRIIYGKLAPRLLSLEPLQLMMEL